MPSKERGTFQDDWIFNEKSRRNPGQGCGGKKLKQGDGMIADAPGAVKPAELESSDSIPKSCKCWACTDKTVGAFINLLADMADRAPGFVIRDDLKQLKDLGFKITLVYPEGV